MIDIVLTAEDPEVPEDCIPNACVRVVQYIKPSGDIGFAIRISSDVPLSQTLGLLLMAGIHAYLVTEPGGPRTEP